MFVSHNLHAIFTCQTHAHRFSKVGFSCSSTLFVWFSHPEKNVLSEGKLRRTKSGKTMMTGLQFSTPPPLHNLFYIVCCCCCCCYCSKRIIFGMTSFCSKYTNIMCEYKYPAFLRETLSILPETHFIILIRPSVPIEILPRTAYQNPGNVFAILLTTFWTLRSEVLLLGFN